MEAVREEEYVTLQVHDAQLGRIEALIERNLARQEAIASDLKGEIRELCGEIKAIEAKVDGLEKKVDARFEHLEDMIAMTNDRITENKSSNLALWAIAAAVGICAFQAIVSLISLLK